MAQAGPPPAALPKPLVAAPAATAGPPLPLVVGTAVRGCVGPRGGGPESVGGPPVAATAGEKRGGPGGCLGSSARLRGLGAAGLLGKGARVGGALGASGGGGRGGGRRVRRVSPACLSACLASLPPPASPPPLLACLLAGCRCWEAVGAWANPMAPGAVRPAGPWLGPAGPDGGYGVCGYGRCVGGGGPPFGALARPPSLALPRPRSPSGLGT